MTRRPACAVEKMRPIRGHTLTGLKQELTVRAYADGGGSLEIDGRNYAFASRGEALAMLDEYLRHALERAAAARGDGAAPAPDAPAPADAISSEIGTPSSPARNGSAGTVDREGGG